MSEAKRLTLLAIDDNPESLELITAALANERLEILTASDPEVGFEAFLQFRPESYCLTWSCQKWGYGATGKNGGH